MWTALMSEEGRAYPRMLSAGEKVSRSWSIADPDQHDFTATFDASRPFRIDPQRLILHHMQLLATAAQRSLPSQHIEKPMRAG